MVVCDTPQKPSQMDSICLSTITPGASREPFQIAIIGGGPRGISIVERICASVSADCPVRIHIIDPGLKGGSVWNPKPSNDELLMNTVASQVTVFTDATVTCSGPIRPGPSLYEWSIQPDNNHHFRLGPNDYPTRSQYGHYLIWALSYIIANAPDNVHIESHAARAIRLADSQCGRHQTILLSNHRVLRDITAVVLAQGHLPQKLTQAEQHHAKHASAENLRYIPPDNPANVELGMIQPKEKVFLQGLGLCFFDYVSHFTLGRGGKFTTESDGSLRYHPSGREPIIYAGSWHGVPSHARPLNQKGVDGHHDPVLLTDSQLEQFRHRANQGKPPSFSQEILPLIMREMEYVYYMTLLRQRGQDSTGFQHVALADPHTPLTPPILEQFGIGRKDQESWQFSLRPPPPPPMSFADHRDWMLSYLEDDSSQALLGNVDGPHGAGRDALRDLRNNIRAAVDHDGISGHSREVDLDKTFTSFSNYICVGPPRSRIEELIALIKADVVSIMGPRMTIEQRPNMWVVKSPSVPGFEVQTRTFIEARLPKTNLSTTADPLMSYLIQTGQCRRHTIDGYETGGIDITESPYRLKDGLGRPHPTRFVTGVPTEGVHWTTTAGARPGVDSVMLRESDAIAQEVCT
ncbi:FAD-NAD(P)-binding-domain-containing protein [Poronia punctata]|nr:FAD-NAD(P)-binding-domain-containing protein [Poronia punctata]